MRSHTVVAFAVLIAGCVSENNGPGTPAGDPDAAEPALDAGEPAIDAATPDAPPPDAPPTNAVRVCSDQPHTTIAAGVAAAGPGGIVDICPGIYHERLQLFHEITLHGAGAATTIIDGDAMDTVVRVYDLGTIPVRIEGVTIRNGSWIHGGGVSCRDSTLALVGVAVLDNRTIDDGAGLEARSCDIRLERTTFSGNRTTGTSSGNGGAACLSGCTTVIEDSRFIDNRSTDDGGAVWAGGGSITIHGSLFENNQSGGIHNGGGLWLAADAVVHSTTVRNNRASYGGGLFYSNFFPVNPAARLELSASLIEGNQSFAVAGGAYIDGGEIQLVDNVVRGNIAGYHGGGLYLRYTTGEIDQLTLQGNHSSRSGGGAYFESTNHTITGIQVRNNAAAEAGGGIFTVSDSSTYTGGELSGNLAPLGGAWYGVWAGTSGVSFANLRVEYNQATDGGGFFFDDNYGALQLRGVSFHGNRASDDGGAIHTTSSAVHAMNTRFVGNRATRGGAIWSGTEPPPTDQWDHPCECTSVVHGELLTFHANLASDGAAIWHDGPTLVMRGAILSDSIGGAQVAIHQPPPDGWFHQPRPYPTVTWAYNDTFPASFTGIPDPTGSDGNLAAAPAFRDPLTEDFHLAAGSPCIDTGPPEILDLADGSRADMGMWAGSVVGLP